MLGLQNGENFSHLTESERCEGFLRFADLGFTSTALRPRGAARFLRGKTGLPEKTMISIPNLGSIRLSSRPKFFGAALRNLHVSLTIKIKQR